MTQGVTLPVVPLRISLFLLFLLSTLSFCSWSLLDPPPLQAEPLAEAGADGVWSNLPPAPTKRTEVTATSIKGKIYVIGGFEEPSLGNLSRMTISPKVEEFDPAINQWRPRAPLPTPLHHAAAVTIGARLYVVGGYKQSFVTLWNPVASLYIYDPEADAWTEGPPMPTPRGALAATEVGGMLVAIGGYDGQGNLAAVEAFDPAQRRWTSWAPLPTPRDHLAAATVDGLVYAIGGRLNRDYGKNLNVTEVFDPATNRWARAPDLPTARSGIAAGVIEDIIYVLGGEAPVGTFRTNEAYDPHARTWSAAPPMPTGRHGLGAAVVAGRLFVLSGGPTPGGSYSDVIERFDPPARLRPFHSAAPRIARDDADGRFSPRRASPAQVGAVMALLATFEEARALPPETSRDAPHIVKALIQFQAAFMKSDRPSIRHALDNALGDESAVTLFRTKGWTSHSFQAIMARLAEDRLWADPDFGQGLRAYNVGREDYDLLASVFAAAQQAFAKKGTDFHTAYTAKRREMPGSADTAR